MAIEIRSLAAADSQRVARWMAGHRGIEQAAQRRTDWLPSKCPNCGAPLSVATVQWTGTETADCPYCNAHLKATSRA